MVVKGDEDTPSWKERIKWVVERYEDGNMSNASRSWGVSPQAVAKLCSGGSEPSADTLATMLRTYPGLNPRWLLLGEGEQEQKVPLQESAASMAIERVLEILTAVPKATAPKRGVGEPISNEELLQGKLQTPPQRQPKRRAGG